MTNKNLSKAELKIDSNSRFLNWLKSKSNIINIEYNNSKYSFMKYPYSDDIYLLYSCQVNFIGIDSKFKYCGIYDKEKDTLYDIGYDLRKVLDISWDNNPYLDSSDLMDKISSEISECVTNYVLDNKDEFYEAAKDYISNVNKEDIIDDFLDNTKSFEYEYKRDYVSNQEVLKYLAEDNFIYDISFDYIEKNKKFIGEVLKDNYIKNKYLNEIETNKSYSIHKAREIRNSLKADNYVSVHVFINKNDIDFDFRYNCSLLIYSCGESYISIYNMYAPDRRKYEEYFGYEDFNYKDIYKIEYRSKPIYEDKNFFNKKEAEKEEAYLL